MDEQFPQHAGFVWLPGYGAFSVSRSHLRAVIEYVRNQKVHHRTGNLWDEWEETDEEYEPEDPD